MIRKATVLLIFFILVLSQGCFQQTPDSEDHFGAENSHDQGAAPEILMEEPVKTIRYHDYKVVSGDTISGIAEIYDLRTDTLLSVNKITRSRSLQINTLLKIPNQDGLLHKIDKDVTAQELAEKYDVPAEDLVKVNALPHSTLQAGTEVFLPGARLETNKLREINGDLFVWPAKGYISSRYGYRRDPFTGTRSFHNAIDLAGPIGTAVRAAMDGTVVATGFQSSSGNYITVRHHNGYSTLYAHLSEIAVSEGRWVKQGQRIGAMGNSGYSTGPHLHFAVFQHGRSLNPLYVLH